MTSRLGYTQNFHHQIFQHDVKLNASIERVCGRIEHTQFKQKYLS